MDLGQLAIASAISFAAIGSALGTGVAGMAAVGAWKKCFAQNRTAPFLLVAFVGFPLSQTIYGMILMNTIRESGAESLEKLGAGIFGGIAIGFSAFMQGRAAASASDALAETGKGFSNYVMVLGIIETVDFDLMRQDNRRGDDRSGQRSASDLIDPTDRLVTFIVQHLFDLNRFDYSFDCFKTH